jgi:hypothetical protein
LIDFREFLFTGVATFTRFYTSLFFIYLANVTEDGSGSGFLQPFGVLPDGRTRGIHIIHKQNPLAGDAFFKSVNQMKGAFERSQAFVARTCFAGLLPVF